jgi:hypothetical protein
LIWDWDRIGIWDWDGMGLEWDGMEYDFEWVASIARPVF